MGSQRPARSVAIGIRRRAAALAIAVLWLAGLSPLTSALAAPADAFVGTWDTYTSIQPFPHFALTISKTGPAHLHGTYQPQPTDALGQIDGNVIGNVLHYTWILGPVSGTGTFTISGDSISGMWSTSGPAPASGTWDGTRTTSGGGTPPTPPTPAPPSGSLPTAQIATDANVHAGPNKNSPVVTTLGGGSVVAYDPSCPGGYCLVYWQGSAGNAQQGYVWQALLGLGGVSGATPPMPSGVADFSGSWSLDIDQPGGSTQKYIMQVTQSGANATATLNSSPPSTITCTISGAQMSCTWSTGGTDLAGDFALSGSQISGAWSVVGSPGSGAAWNGTRM